MLSTSKIGSNTKKDISRIFAKLRDFGFLVFNFNSNKKLNRGKMTGFCDHLIIGKGKIYFIEVKIGKDTIKPEQFLLQRAIDETEADFRFITSSKEAEDLRDFILTN